MDREDIRESSHCRLCDTTQKRCMLRLMKRKPWEIEHSDIVMNKVVDEDSSRVVDDHVSDVTEDEDVSDVTEDEDVSGVTEDEDEDQEEIDKGLERDGYRPFVNCGSDGRKLRLPSRHQSKELLRLMKRGRKTTEIPDGTCCICGDDSHFHYGCPCKQKIPEGVIINDKFDQVCIGCGRIGQNCCSKGVYAEYKECAACRNGGHWFWEGMCKENFVRPPWLVKILSMKEDEVMVEDVDSGKKDGDKGGNESSKQFSLEKMKDFLDSLQEGDSMQ